MWLSLSIKASQGESALQYSAQTTWSHAGSSLHSFSAHWATMTAQAISLSRMPLLSHWRQAYIEEDVLYDLNLGSFLRGDAVVAMVKALHTTVKGSSDVALLDTLVGAGVISEEAADEFVAGFQVKGFSALKNRRAFCFA